MLREQIAKNLYWVGAAAKYGVGFSKWETLTPEQQDYLYEQADALILSPLKRKIKEIKNPYPEDRDVEEYRFGFWLALQKVLEALES